MEDSLQSWYYVKSLAVSISSLSMNNHHFEISVNKTIVMIETIIIAQSEYVN